jgi:predicted Zn-dependent protease
VAAAPGDAALAGLYGRALLLAGDPAAARPHLQAAAAVLDSPRGWIDLGDACAALGDHAAARAAWQRARDAGASAHDLGPRE